MNVLGTNQDSSRAIRLIQQTKPDILTIAEYNERWQAALEHSGVLKGYQGHFVVPYGNDGVYTRFPIQGSKVEYVRDRLDPMVAISFRWQKTPITLLVLHPRPPVKPGWYLRHRAHFTKLEKDFPAYGSRVILVGDLNTSPWSATFQHFIQTSGLRDSQLGFGVQPSWPTYVPKLNIPLPVCVIPIDHVLVSLNFQVNNRQIGPDIGSDHRPVIVDLAL